MKYTTTFEDLLRKYSSYKRIPYSELLSTTQWGEKREIILKRDFEECQKCYKAKPSTNYFDDCEHFFRIRNKFKRPGKKFKSYAWKDKVWYFTGEDIDIDELFNVYEPTVSVIYRNTGSKFKAILMPVTSPFVLHVHHKYYIEDALPWEYEDEALVTYCNNCHLKWHEDNEVEMYTMYGNKLINPNTLTKCTRCFGAGFFEEYIHVKNGICFECNGERFEEFYK